MQSTLPALTRSCNSRGKKRADISSSIASATVTNKQGKRQREEEEERLKEEESARVDRSPLRSSLRESFKDLNLKKDWGDSPVVHRFSKLCPSLLPPALPVERAATYTASDSSLPPKFYCYPSIPPAVVGHTVCQKKKRERKTKKKN